MDFNFKRKNKLKLSYQASLNGSPEIAEILLKFKANINILDNDKKTALMIAVIKGNDALVQVLINYGANLEIRNEFGKSPYDVALSMEKKVYQINPFFVFFLLKYKHLEKRASSNILKNIIQKTRFSHAC